MKKLLFVLYGLCGLGVYLNLYFGISNFFTTGYTYSLVALLCFYSFKKLRLSPAVALGVYAFLFSLFAAEFSIRYILKYPLSYGEQNGGDYILVDRHQKRNDFLFKYIKGRKDIYTLQFDSGEIRNYSCPDYPYPDERCNAFGLRGALPDKNKKIILTLGDSFTEGLGAPADSCYPALLRNYIVAKDSLQDVLNAGVAGNDIFFDWKMLQKLQDRYQLKQLIFLMNVTDVNDVATRGGKERFKPDGFLQFKARPAWEPLYAVSFVFRLFMHNVFKLDYNLQTEQQVTARNAEALNKIQELMKKEIIPWSQQHGTGILFVLHPLRHQVKENDLLYRQMLYTLQQVNGAKVLDCLPAIKTQNRAEDLYWPNDQHFKPAGYNIIANLVIDSCYR